MVKPLSIGAREFRGTVLRADRPVLVEFATSRCPACLRLEPVLERLSGEYDGRVTFARVDVEAEPILGEAFGITAVPTLVLFKDAAPVDGAVGAPSAAAVRSLIEAHLGCAAPRRSGLG